MTGNCTLPEKQQQRSANAWGGGGTYNQKEVVVIKLMGLELGGGGAYNQKGLFVIRLMGL